MKNYQIIIVVCFYSTTMHILVCQRDITCSDIISFMEKLNKYTQRIRRIAKGKLNLKLGPTVREAFYSYHTKFGAQCFGFMPINRDVKDIQWPRLVSELYRCPSRVIFPKETRLNVHWHMGTSEFNIDTILFFNMLLNSMGMNEESPTKQDSVAIRRYPPYACRINNLY